MLAKQRGLGCAVPAEQPGHRPALDVEADVVQGELAAVAPGLPMARTAAPATEIAGSIAWHLSVRLHPSGASFPAAPTSRCLKN